MLSSLFDRLESLSYVLVSSLILKGGLDAHAPAKKEKRNPPSHWLASIGGQVRNAFFTLFILFPLFAPSSLGTACAYLEFFSTVYIKENAILGKIL